MGVRCSNASKALQEDGLRRYMADLALARQVFILCLLASQTPLTEESDGLRAAKVLAGVTTGVCILTNLGAHGV